MTVAGGMVCSDGVILYADTQWTMSTLKIQRAKQWLVLSDRDGLKVAAAAAGHEGYVQYALHQLTTGLDLLANKGEPLTLQALVDYLSASLINTFGYIKQGHRDDDVAFVLAAATDKEGPVLLKTTDAVVDTVVDGTAHIGCGAEMATYLASKVYADGIPISVAERLAAYILWEVKGHVPGCGGDSIIYRLTKERGLQYRGWGDIRDYERHFTDVERRIGRFRLATADLAQSEEDFEKTISNFLDDMRLFRKARIVAAEIDSGVGVRKPKKKRVMRPTPQGSKRGR